jgi:spermidine synthase
MLVWAARDFLGRWSPRVRTSCAVVATAIVLLSCVTATGRQLRFWQNSETLFRHALAVTSDNMVVEYDLAEALVRLGRTDEAQRHLQRAIVLNPGYVQALARLADLHSRSGNTSQAISEYRQALDYAPDFVVALNNLAWLLATVEDPRSRDAPGAVRLAERACALTHSSLSALDTLAAAYAADGRFDDAVATQERALGIALALGRNKQAAGMSRSIEAYRAKRAIHGEQSPPQGIATKASGSD